MLSQKSKYALKALGYLAKNQAGGPVLMSTISKEKKNSAGFFRKHFS